MVMRHMQWTKHKSITAVFAISSAAAAAWFAFVSFDRAGAFDEKPESGWIHEECDYTDYYFNQHLNDDGVCTHDLSYTEPAIPVGSYYPDGDASADYYMEITSEDGKYYMTYKSPDGSLYGGATSEYYGKKQFIVHTIHSNDSVVICTQWHDRTSADDDGFSEGLWPGEKIIVDGTLKGVVFNDDGSVDIQPYDLGAGYNQSDVRNGIYMKMAESR